MRSVSGLALLASVAFSMSSAAHADLLLAFSDAEYDALNADASPFVEIGGGYIQWGNTAVTGTATTPTASEWGIVSSTGAQLTTGNQPWAKVTNTLLPTTASTPLWSYSSAGKLTMAFKSGTTAAVSTSATIGKGANAFWIRAAMPPKGSLGSVALAGLLLTFTSDRTTYDLGSLTADTDSDYVGFYDPRLALGFTIKWGFGYLNNYGGDAAGNNPSFQFNVGSYVTPPANPYLSYSTPVDFGDDPLASTSSMLQEVDFNNLAAVPEPASWALMISGFGMIGGALRRRRLIAA